jgi:peptidoglycan/LPS O-acetylase OafA/YrhL
MSFEGARVIDPQSNRRLPELDGVRGVAAFGILIWHYIPSIAVRVPGSLISYTDRLLSLAWSGVDLFFVLSGFLIGSILLRESGSPRYFRTFYARRAARILPLYVLMLAALVAGTIWMRFGAPVFARPLFENKLPWWSFLVFAQNFFMPGIDDFGPKIVSVTWSLAVEEQFYLLLPLIIFVIPRRRLPLVLGALFLVGPLLRLQFTPGAATYVLLPFRLDSLMAGATLAWIWSQPSAREWISKHRDLFLLAWWILAIPAPFVLRGGAGLWALRSEHGWVLNSWLALWFSVTLVLLLEGRGWASRFFRAPVLQWLGRIAYGLYLFHPAFLWFAHGVILRAEPVLSDVKTAAVTALATVLSLIAATAAYRWIEAPALTFGKRFKY